MEKEKSNNSGILNELPILGNISVLETIKCKSGNHGSMVCFENGCQNYPFMCGDRKCACRGNHQNCMKTQVLEFIEKFENRVLNLSNLVNHHCNQIDKTIKRLQFQMSQMKTLFKSQINKKLKNLNFSQKELAFLMKIQQNRIEDMKGGDFFKVYQEVKLNKSNSAQFNEDQEVKAIKSKWHSIEAKMLEQIQSIRTMWNSNANKNCFYDQSKFNKKQQILKIKINQNQQKLPQFLNCGLMESRIVQNTQQCKNIIGFFGNKELIFKLKYRASQNQFKLKSFYQKVSGIQNSLILGTTYYNMKIGGFTSLKWQKHYDDDDDYRDRDRDRDDDDDRYRYYLDRQDAKYFPDKYKTSFLFSLTQNQKLSFNDSNAGIISNPFFGPMFGIKSNPSFGIGFQSNKIQSTFVSFGNVFTHPNYKQNSKQTLKRFSGSQQKFFKMKEWQVWQVSFK